MSVYQRRSRLAGNEAAPIESTAADTTDRSGLAIMKRRSAAARRMLPLDCGCGSDPWMCRCTDPPLSARTIDGYRDAALHILASNRVPIVQAEVLQALWRRGGADRELAELLHKLTGGQVG
jgi:hypothetical protein